MESGSALHRSVVEYLCGDLGLQPVLDRLARELCRDPRRYGLKDEDEVGEVFSRYGKRLVHLVERFEDRGLPFEAYLRSATRYYALSLRRRCAKAADIEAVGLADAQIRYAEDAVSEERMLCCDSGASPRELRAQARLEPRLRVLAERAGYLCLKCARSLEDQELADYARRAGLDPVDLQFKALAARAFGEGGRLRLEERARIRDAAWIRYRSLSRRLEREEDPWKRSHLALKLERERERFQRSLAEARRTRLGISNRMVARLCGIAKGTVDAGIARAGATLRGLPPGAVFPLD